jgi:hypothetical protein
MERVAHRFQTAESNLSDASGSSRSFDFRVRMFEDDGRHLLWEDQFAQGEAGDLAQSKSESTEEKAVELPTWSIQPLQQMLRELI